MNTGLPARKTDAEVIKKAKNGSREAFNTIVRNNRKYIYNLLLQLTGDPAVADDLTQETFLQVFRKLSTFRCEARLRTWISRIAINYYHQNRRKKKYPENMKLEELRIPGNGTNPERQVIKREIEWCIMDALQHRVPPHFREMLVLRDLQGFTYAEISDLLDISQNSVKVRLHRARVALRDHFVKTGCKALMDEYLCMCAEGDVI